MPWARRPRWPQVGRRCGAGAGERPPSRDALLRAAVALASWGQPPREVCGLEPAVPGRPPTRPPALPHPGSAESSALRCASRRLRARGARGRSPPCGVWGPLGAGWASPSAQVPQATAGAPRGRMTPPPRPHRVPGRQALLRAEGLVPRPRRPRPPGGAAAQPCGWDRGATRPPRAASARAETEPPGASGTRKRLEAEPLPCPSVLCLPKETNSAASGEASHTQGKRQRLAVPSTCLGLSGSQMS